jgi:hypothetical protein
VASSSGLRTAARVALVAGAAGSVLLMMRAGARQRSLLLMFLFTVWVLSPFIALAVANVRSSGWQPATRTAAYGAMLGVSFISLSVYALHALIPGLKSGFIYLVVPGACWVLIGMAFATTAALAPKRR